MSSFRQVPFLLLLLPLMAGIVVWRYVSPLSFYGAEPSCIEIEGEYRLWLTTLPQKGDRTYRVEGVLQEISSKAPQTKVKCYIACDSLSGQLRRGDKLIVHTTPRHQNRGNPYEFDYDGWLRGQGIAAVCYVRSGEWQKISHEPIKGLKAAAESCQRWIVSRFQLVDIEGEELGIVSALVAGDKFYLQPETRQRWSVAGASHVLAVSGLHVGIVYGSLEWLLTLFGLFPVLYHQKWRRWLNMIVLLTALWIYAFVTGLSPSVIRACVMFSLFAFSRALGRDSNTYNILFAAAFLTLLFSPQSLFNISFQLSYSAVLSIVFFHKQFGTLCHPRFFVLKWAWELLLVSVSAQIGTLPFTLYYFSQTANYFALTNFFIIPMAQLLLYTVILFLPLSFCVAGKWIGWLLAKELWLTNEVLDAIGKLPGASLQVSIPLPVAGMLVLFVLLSGAWLVYRRWQWIVAMVLAGVMIVFLQWNHLSQISGSEELTVFNSSPYNVIVIREGRELTIVTDSVSSAERLTENYRKKLMITQLNYTDVSEEAIYSFVFQDESYLWIRRDIFDNKKLTESISCKHLYISELLPWHQDALQSIRYDDILLLPAMPNWQKEKNMLIAAENLAE